MSKEENKTVEEIKEDERVIEPEIIEKTEIEPVLRGGGLRGVGHPEMIQTHLDNFLAKIAAGDTAPIDTNVRTSMEFWLNEIAGWTAGQSTDDASTKKIYRHDLDLYTSSVISMNASIFSADNTPINTTTKLTNWFNSISGRVDLHVNGGGSVNGTVRENIFLIRKQTEGSYIVVYTTSSGYGEWSFGNVTSLFNNVGDTVTAIN